MAIASNCDQRLWPVHADTPDQPAQMSPHFAAVRRWAGTQDGQYAMAGLSVIYMDGREPPLIVMSVEQRQLLMAVNGSRRVVDIEDDGLRGFPVASAPQINQPARQTDQSAQVR